MIIYDWFIEEHAIVSGYEMYAKTVNDRDSARTSVIGAYWIFSKPELCE